MSPEGPAPAAGARAVVAPQPIVAGTRAMCFPARNPKTSAGPIVEPGPGYVRPMTDAELLPAQYKKRPSMTEPSSRSTCASAPVSRPPLVPRSPGTSRMATNAPFSSGPRFGFGRTSGSP